MNTYPIHIKPFGTHALLVEWPFDIQKTILEDILIFKDYLKTQGFDKNNWEMVPAYNSLALINRKEEIDHETMSKKLHDLYLQRVAGAKKQSYLWKLPVCYDPEFGIDLEEVAGHTGKTVEQIIAMHTATPYTVYGIGFLPGFLYLGGIPKELETPRKATPRLRVQKGAVGLARKQTGIYPQESPGGWNIIGNCPIPIFDAKKENPCFVNVGDTIQFYSITRAQFDLRKIQAEVGIDLLKKVPSSA